MFAQFVTSLQFRTTVVVRRREGEFSLARYIGPVCRLCRREGMKLFLKGERCFKPSCGIEKRNFSPGQNATNRKARIMGYALQCGENHKGRRSSAFLEI